MSRPSIRPSAPRAARAARIAATGAAALGLALLAPAAASAHVHVSPGGAAAGETVELGFAVGHGCDGSPTTAIRITVPDEVAALTPIANPGWLVEPFADGSGRGVLLTAESPLPDGVRDTLELEVTIADDVAEGTTLAFPVDQTCESGATYAWAGPADGEEPAPEIVVGSASAASTDDEHAGRTADEHAEHGGAAAGGTEAAAAAPPAQGADGAQPLTIAALLAAVVAAVLATIALRRQASARAGERS